MRSRISSTTSRSLLRSQRFKNVCKRNIHSGPGFVRNCWHRGDAMSSSWTHEGVTRYCVMVDDSIVRKKHHIFKYLVANTGAEFRTHLRCSRLQNCALPLPTFFCTCTTQYKGPLDTKVDQVICICGVSKYHPMYTYSRHVFFKPISLKKSRNNACS